MFEPDGSWCSRKNFLFADAPSAVINTTFRSAASGFPSTSQTMGYSCSAVRVAVAKCATRYSRCWLSPHIINCSMCVATLLAMLWSSSSRYRSCCSVFPRLTSSALLDRSSMTSVWIPVGIKYRSYVLIVCKSAQVYTYRVRHPWIMGHPFSAVQRLITTSRGQLEGHAKQTWCTSLELNWPFLQRVGADNAKCLKIYISGRSSCISGHWLTHRET